MVSFFVWDVTLHMSQKLMDVLMLGRCSHEFSWPRRAGKWRVLPGLHVVRDRFQYDWQTMRRGDRVDEPVADTESARRHSAEKQPTWMPRARRYGKSSPFDIAERI